MQQTWVNQRWVTLLIAVIALAGIVLFVKFPEQVFQASLQGVRIWWRIVFPSLLPFLILSEMLTTMGIIRMLGRALDPLTRKLWGTHGSSGLAAAVGWTAGFPAAVGLTAELRRDNVITRQDGERMLALTHMCNPAFLAVVVGAGFLHDSRIGWFLIVVQWLSLLVLGVLMRIHMPLNATNDSASNDIGPSNELLGETSFGKVMGDAVKRSIDQLMIIGGIIMFFSVAVTLLQITVPVWQTPLPATIIRSVSEIHIGTFALSQLSGIPYIWILACLGCVFGWSGFAAHLQVQAFLRGTDLRYSRFLLARFMHGAIAFSITFLLSIPFANWLRHPHSVFAQNQPVHIPTATDAWLTVLLALGSCIIVTTVLLIASKLVYWISHMHRSV